MLSLLFFGYYNAHARSRASKCDRKKMVTSLKKKNKRKTCTFGALVLGDGVPFENQLTCLFFLDRLSFAVFRAVYCEKTAEPSSFTNLTIPSND
jgi:hypothetical protein